RGRGKRAAPRHHPPARRGGHPRLPAGARVRLARAAIPGDHVPIGGCRMPALAPTAATARPAPARRPFLPLVRADLLKLRRNRGLLAAAAAMTIGPILVAYTTLLILPPPNPPHPPPAPRTPHP